VRGRYKRMQVKEHEGSTSVRELPRRRWQRHMSRTSTKEARPRVRRAALVISRSDDRGGRLASGCIPVRIYASRNISARRRAREDDAHHPLRTTSDTHTHPVHTAEKFFWAQCR
jgi:hypothetical protein